MKRHFLLPVTLLFLLPGHRADATICQWNGAAMGNWSDPANWSCGTTPGIGDTVQLTGKSVVLNESATIQALILLQNCTIGGAGTLTVSGKIDIQGGGNHTFLSKIVSNGQLVATQATLNFNAQPFIVAGAANFIMGAFWMNNGGTFEIAPTGSATFQGRNNFYCYNPYIGFVVRGTVYKTDASDMIFESLYLFKNASINIQSGSLINYYEQSPAHCIIDSTVVNIAADAALAIERLIDIKNSTITGAGKIRIGVGQCKFFPPNTILADVEQNSGVCGGYTGTDTLANYTLLGGNMSGGLYVKGNFTWIKGSMNSMVVAGFTTISDTTAASTNQKFLAGKLTLNGGGQYSGNDQLSGTVTIPANTVFTLNAKPLANFNADLQVFGTLRKTNPDAVSVGFVTNNGRIEGTGKLNGFVVTFGTLAPGIDAGTGTLAFNGPNLLIQPQAILEIQVVNPGTSVAADRLQLSGRCKLDGTLKVLTSGNIPPGDYVVVQASDSLTGQFSAVQLPPDWEMIRQPFSMILRKHPAPPDAHFSVAHSGCTPALVQFTDASTGDSLAYFWTFPGGTPASATDKNPAVTYATPGSYTASLTVTNTAGSSTRSTDFVLWPSMEAVYHVDICSGDTFYFNGQPLHLSGVYQQSLINTYGCDSLLTLYLNVQTVDGTVVQNGDSLTASAANATFQWLNCADGMPIPGATGAVFLPENSGAFAVLVTQNGCLDTSACFPVTVVGTRVPVENSGSFQVNPNPATDFIQVQYRPQPDLTTPDAVVLFDVHGVQKARFEPLEWNGQHATLDVHALENGMYFGVLEQVGRRHGVVRIAVVR